jgi:hypothetical protein
MGPHRHRMVVVEWKANYSSRVAVGRVCEVCGEYQQKESGRWTTRPCPFCAADEDCAFHVGTVDGYQGAVQVPANPHGSVTTITSNPVEG